MATLEALSKALRSGAQGQAQLAGLDEKYARANTLRDNTAITVDQYGQSSPLAAIADLFNDATGRRMLKEVEAPRAQARQDIAQAATALPLYKAGVNADAVTYGKQRDVKADAHQDKVFTQNQNNFNTERTDSINAAIALKQAKEAEAKKKLDREDASGTLISKINPDTGEETTLRYNKHTKKAYKDGEEVPNLSEWKDVPTKTEEITKGGYGGKTYDKHSNENWNSIMAVDNVNSLISNVTPEQAALLNSPEHRFKMAAIEKLAPQEFAALAESSFSGYDEATQRMLTALNATSAEERHRMFGSALTETEMKSTQKFLAATLGRGLPWIMNALEENKKKNINSLLAVDGSYGDNKYKQMLANRGIIGADYKPAAYKLGEQPEAGSGLNKGHRPTGEMSIEELQAELANE